MPLPWDPKVARVFCTLLPRPRGTEDAGLVPDGRLPRQPQAHPGGARGRRPACTCAPALEPEMMWLKLNADGTPSVEGMTKPYCYHIDQFSRVPADHPQGDRVRPEDGPRHDPGRPRGRPGPARAELQLRPRRGDGRQPHDLPPDLPAGRAASCSAFPCFMPKPFMGVSANGCHHNISLWQGDENLFMPETRRPAAAEQDRPLGDRRRARAPRRADRRSRASTVNSYRRLWDTGFWAPVFADWGFQNRTTALRVSAPGPLRVPLGRLGRQPVPVAGGADRGDAATASTARSIRARPRSATSTQAMEAGKDVKKIPMTFGDALDALDADEVVKICAAGRDVQGLLPLQARRVGALLRPGQRLGRQGVPRRPAVARARATRLRTKEHTQAHVRNRRNHLPGRTRTPIGHDMTRMLQSMKHRGPDSTGFALYAPPTGDVVMRYKLADANDPRDFDFLDRLERHQREVEVRLGNARRAGRSRSRPRRSTPTASRSSYDGDLKKLADYVEDVAGRRGALARHTRSRSSRTWATPRRWPTSTTSAASGARTRSATCAWRPSPTSTSRARTPTGRTRSRTWRSCTTASSRTTSSGSGASSAAATASSPSATPRSSRSTWPRR